MTDEAAAPGPGIDDYIPMPEDLSQLPPPNPWYQVVGRKSTYMVKRTMFGQVMLELRELDHLPDKMSTLWKDIPKIPIDLLNQAWSFFRWANATRNSEAMVFLLWIDDAYQLFVPTQDAVGLGVHASFDPKGIPEGAKVCGSIHSHQDIGAFHSGTDEGDADDHDGIHITIGHVSRKVPDMAAMISFGGKSWDLQRDEYFEGKLAAGPFPAEWKAKMVGLPRPQPKWRSKDGALVGTVTPGSKPMGYVPHGSRIDDYGDAWWLSEEYLSYKAKQSSGGWRQKPNTPVTKLPKAGSMWPVSSVDFLLEEGRFNADELAEAQAIDDEMDLLSARALTLGLDLDIRIYNRQEN